MASTILFISVRGDVSFNGIGIQEEQQRKKERGKNWSNFSPSSTLGRGIWSAFWFRVEVNSLLKWYKVSICKSNETEFVWVVRMGKSLILIGNGLTVCLCGLGQSFPHN